MAISFNDAVNTTNVDAAHSHAISERGCVMMDNSQWMVDLLALRFFGPKRLTTANRTLPFKHVHCCYINAEVVCVLLVVEGRNDPVILKDNADMFPSDPLVTQLRLLAG